MPNELSIPNECPRPSRELIDPQQYYLSEATHWGSIFWDFPRKRGNSLGIDNFSPKKAQQTSAMLPSKAA